MPRANAKQKRPADKPAESKPKKLKAETSQSNEDVKPDIKEHNSTKESDVSSNAVHDTSSNAVPSPPTSSNTKNGQNGSTKKRSSKKDDPKQNSTYQEPSQSKQKKPRKTKDDKPVITNDDKSSVTNETSTSHPPKKEDPSEDSDDDEMYRWWEQENNNDSVKWNTLHHNGVLFPPDYKPHGVKMLYKGKPVHLLPPAEEVATFYAGMLHTDYTKNPVFQQNFFEAFQDVLSKAPPLCGTEIDQLQHCDFTPIFEHLDRERAAKKALSSAEKKAIKAEKDAFEEPYKFALLDGRREKVGNFRVEPPGLFRGRGQHPRTGRLKPRIQPEDITLNLSEDAPVPKAPEGHSWKDVIHDNTLAWLAMWKEFIGYEKIEKKTEKEDPAEDYRPKFNVKYVFLAPTSSLKGQSDIKKFEKARSLKDHIDHIRAEYTRDLTSKSMYERQRATAVYFIDRFALRAGNEKGEDEADTYGCCTLQVGHITLEPPSKVHFDFLGKDSVRFKDTKTVDPQVLVNLRKFCAPPKRDSDHIFDRISTQVVNKYLSGFMEGLTAKVFRTYNASVILQELLKRNTPKSATVEQKLLAYNAANREVAIICNHQKSVSQNHETQMSKMHDKYMTLLYQRRKLRYALIHALSEDPKLRKVYEKQDEPGLTEQWITDHEDNLVVLEDKKIRTKFEKENAARAENGSSPLPATELDSRLENMAKLRSQLDDARKNGWTQTRLSVDRLIDSIGKIDKRIDAHATLTRDREQGKDVALGTSKINYIDPRITFAWCKEYEVPPTKIFSKSLIEKFPWARDVGADFEF